MLWAKAFVAISLLTLALGLPQANAKIRIAGSGSVIVDNILVTMTVHPQEISIGEEVNITIIAENLDSVNRTLYPQTACYAFDVEVFNETFSWLWSQGQFCIMIMPEPVVLQPGQNYTENKEWDLSINVNDSFVSPQAGSYGMRTPDPLFPGIFVPITIVPEFQSFVILPLFMMATLLAVMLYRMRAQTGNDHKKLAQHN